MSRRTRPGAAPVLGSWSVVAGVCALLVFGAVALEVGAGLGAASAVSPWAAFLVPLTWPPALRVAWWLVLAVAAAGFRLALHRLGVVQRPWVVAASVAPFVIFAAAIGLGADWATWH